MAASALRVPKKRFLNLIRIISAFAISAMIDVCVFGTQLLLFNRCVLIQDLETGRSECIYSNFFKVAYLYFNSYLHFFLEVFVIKVMMLGLDFEKWIFITVVTNLSSSGNPVSITHVLLKLRDLLVKIRTTQVTL